MKHAFLFLAIVGLCSISTVSHAQSQSNLDIGLRAGVNIANDHFDPVPSGGTLSSKIGFIGGGQIDYWVGMFGFGAQLLFDQKGVSASISQTASDGTVITGTGVITANYIEIPLTVKARFGEGSTRPYLFAGPTIGILLSASEHVTVPASAGQGFDSTEDVKNQYTSTDIGIVAGAGVTFDLTRNTSLMLEAGYAYGVANIASNSGNTGATNTANSRDIRLSVGILFGQ